MNFIFVFILTAVISALSTLIVKQTALKFSILDKPNLPRKIHQKAVPLLGGVAIFFSFFLALFLLLGPILSHGLTAVQLAAFFCGGVILIVGGVLDDIKNLSPRQHIIFSVLATLVTIAGGISIVKITNPAGGLFYFGSFASILLTFVWLVGMTYTTKLLDGVDGLVSGLGVISGLIIFLFTMTTRYYQPDVGLMALLFAAACFGFLLFNFYPAKIFLGDGGSLLVGYVIAVLAIISGAKIAVALLIMGIPILDVAWTILRRLWARQNPFRAADRKHLHHRFLAMGLSQPQTVFVYYFFAIFFGMLALFLQSQGKVIAIGVLAIVMILLVFTSIFLPRFNFRIDKK
jgi:UDP-GlcNAc:undecaprenyl-phosphate GlcNAc-1-phosphate transferase